MWLLSQLRIPRLRDIAAGEAALADFILVSVHYAERLPAEVESWIELWLQEKGRRAVLLSALLDPVYEGNSSAIQVWLKEAADRGQMEFLAESAEAVEDR
jgi:hypothetical protein